MSLPELKVAVLNFGTSVVLTLDGHLNAHTVDSLEKSLDAVLATETRLVIFDCATLSFTSSAGLRVFLATVKRMKTRGGTCAFAALNPTVHEVFEMAGFLEAMEVHATREVALAANSPETQGASEAKD
jgi:anti-anti-sigma factor